MKVNPRDGLAHYMCHRCGGIMLGDMPRKFIKNKAYHPHCADKEEAAKAYEKKKDKDE